MRQAGHMRKITQAARRLMDPQTPTEEAAAQLGFDRLVGWWVLHHLGLVGAPQVWQDVGVGFDHLALYAQPAPQALGDLAAIWALFDGFAPEALADHLGWMHQYFQAETKARILAQLDHAHKVTASEVAVATQIFTPDWIVRSLLENALAPIWRAHRPDSALVSRLVWAGGAVSRLKITGAQDIRLCDPACGAGQMLTQSYDLLYDLYLEEGHPPRDIPALIISRNLVGMDIDPLAVALCQFALLVKMASHLGGDVLRAPPVWPQVHLLQDIAFSDAERADLDGRCPHGPVGSVLRAFEGAGLYGALISPPCTAGDARLTWLAAQGDERLRAVAALTRALTQGYHVVVANPPYMGARHMEPRLMARVKEIGGRPRFDLFAAMMLRMGEMLVQGGEGAFLTPNVWLYLPTYEGVRSWMMDQMALHRVIELPLAAFAEAKVQLCAFNFAKGATGAEADFLRLVDCTGGMAQIGDLVRQGRAQTFRVSPEVFRPVTGRIFAYWLNGQSLALMGSGRRLGDLAEPKQGLATTDNDRFLRLWHELPADALTRGVCSRAAAKASGRRWFPYNKGGDYRRWYGNNLYAVDWGDDGAAIKAEVLRKYPYLKGNPDFVTKNQSFYFRQAISWTYINSTNLGVRHSDAGFVFDVAGSSIFPVPEDHGAVLGLLCSKVAKHFIDAINPTLNIQAGSIAAIPLPPAGLPAPEVVDRAVQIARQDWDEQEQSWDFTAHPLVRADRRAMGLPAAYADLAAEWDERTRVMQRLEEANNRAFITAYGLEGVISPDMAPEEITLWANPANRFGLSGPEGAARLRAETAAELLHYLVGCVFGRYDLDRAGIYPKVGKRPAWVEISADAQAGDLADRLERLLGRAFGARRKRASLAWIEAALGRSLRSWVARDFLGFHHQRSRKRPYYWELAAPKGGLRVIVPMHTIGPKVLKELAEDLVPARLAALPDDAVAQDLARWLEGWLRPLAARRPKIDWDAGVDANRRRFDLPALRRAPKG